MVIYSIPVTDGHVNLQLNNLEKGTYSISMINDLGQVFMKKLFIHNGGSASRPIFIDDIVTIGKYSLKLTTENGKAITKNIFIANK